MLNQIQTGRFIAEIRKSKNMTQKELAVKLDISDKTVSKWETGKGMPDVSIMSDLCEILEINVNELLSGEKLSMESYSGKAEENMMNLIKKSEEEKRKQGWEKYGAMTGIFLLAVVLVWVMMESFRHIYWLLDVPSAFILFMIMCIILVTSGTARDLFQAFLVCYGSGDYTVQQIERYLNAVRLFMKGILWSGVFCTLVGLIGTMHSTVLDPDMATFGNMCGVSLIPILYSVILNIILLPTEGRLKNKRYKQR